MNTKVVQRLVDAFEFTFETTARAKKNPEQRPPTISVLIG
jgi:hypothetical protein